MFGALDGQRPPGSPLAHRRPLPAALPPPLPPLDPNTTEVRPALLRKIFSLIYRVLYKLVQIVTGIELPCEVPIGKNFCIEHSGGIVVSGFAKFGDNCRIRNGVVIGLSRVSDPCAPVFGNNVDIGAGAKVLGNIRIGNNVCIGANAVVLQDVPDNCIAVGVPATIKARQSHH